MTTRLQRVDPYVNNAPRNVRHLPVTSSARLNVARGSEEF